MEALVANTRTNYVEVAANSAGYVVALLPLGYQAVGGGYDLSLADDDEASKVVVRASRNEGENGWFVALLNRSSEAVSVSVYVSGIAHKVAKTGSISYVANSGQVPS